MRGSEGGREKSTHRGNSLAAYPTACPVWTGGKAVRPYLSVRLKPGVDMTSDVKSW